MKQFFLGIAVCLGLLLAAPADVVQAGSDSGSDSADSGRRGSNGARARGSRGGRSRGGMSVPELDSAVGGSAIVLLLGGVAYMASRRRNGDSD